MKAQSLLSAIKALGGINMREIRDLSGEGRTGRAGIPVGLFRKPGLGKRSGGLKATGFGLDDLVPRLREIGFCIPDDAVDGGVQELRDMIQAEMLGGEKIYPMQAAEELWGLERDQYLAIIEESRPMTSRLMRLAQELRVERRRDKRGEQ